MFALCNLFPKDKIPLSVRTNGRLMLNGKKTLKSAGNSLTLCEAIEKYGADATWRSLTDVGDGLEDTNFGEKTANVNILHVHRWVAHLVPLRGRQLIYFSLCNRVRYAQAFLILVPGLNS